MRMRNGSQHWGLVARGLHWGMALLILLTVPAGFVMARTYGAPDPVLARWHYWSTNIHHSVGFVLLALAIVRAGWRLAGPVPDAFGGGTERRAARLVHILLYGLLLLIPLSGWAALSSLQASAQFPNPLFLFGIDGFAPGGFIPHIVPPVPWNSPSPWRYGTFARGHRWLLIGGAVLLALHVAAALRHHFILRDATLRRMLKGAGG